jgi:CRISPR-associated endonuclease Cas2
MVNPRKHQKFAVSAAVKMLELLFTTANRLKDDIIAQDATDYIDHLDSSIGRVDISKTIYDLKRRKYIRCEGDSIILTDKAKMKIVDKITQEIPICKKFHFVSFDIPEGMRRNRNQFRRTLKRIGFIQVQKSLWTIKKDVGEIVEAAAREYKVENYVAYFISEKSNIDRFIAKKFDKTASN